MPFEPWTMRHGRAVKFQSTQWTVVAAEREQTHREAWVALVPTPPSSINANHWVQLVRGLV